MGRRSRGGKENESQRTGREGRQRRINSEIVGKRFPGIFRGCLLRECLDHPITLGWMDWFFAPSYRGTPGFSIPVGTILSGAIIRSHSTHSRRRQPLFSMYYIQVYMKIYSHSYARARTHTRPGLFHSIFFIRSFRSSAVSLFLSRPVGSHARSLRRLLFPLPPHISGLALLFLPLSRTLSHPAKPQKL